jgi:hypothetical protein
VEHVVTQDDYDAKKQELMDRIAKAKEAKKVEEDIIEA